MLLKFTTRFGHIVMQGEPGIALLRLAGHTGTVPSAVLAGDLPAFLARLRHGLELHGDQFSPAPVQADPDGPDNDRDEPREQPIKLRLRAVPLIDMIETAVRQKSDLMWETA